ncbi:MAG: SURF1 family protein [Hydrogenophaga sp.]|uniref:SURF1 family protein n=1 Tax=Hydrogenophaga sp. TaxID=1904254 RepID=UPI0025C5B40A|nr:SURF1 family protein [Hydrogenophaga sp.]MBT9550953.1 SURF1 family protein [Hydrogenophaga sp.]
MPSKSPRFRFWLITVAAVLSAGLTASLGLWQLSRAAQKQTLEDRINERAALSPLGETGLPDEAALDEALHRPVLLRGEWVPEASVFLDNRPMGGRSGFILVTPLRLKGSGRSLLVQRGWVPRDFTDRSKVPVVPTPEGWVEVSGRLAPPPSQLFELGEAERGPIRQNLSIDGMSRDTGLSLMPVSVLQTGVSPEGLLRDWPRFEAAVQKHHGYAAQWFAMCAVIAGLYVWFQLISPRRSHSSHGPDPR